jgi:hypothetical protein
MAKNHVTRWKKQRLDENPPTDKKCSVCRQIKPINNFCKDACRPDGYHVWCKECRAPRDKKYREAYREKNYEIVYQKRRVTLMKKHKIKIEAYDEMFKKQGGVCAICGRSSDKVLHIDHNHVTGKVRGLLCSNCNLGIGNLKDSPDICKKAAKYIEDNA